MIIIASLVEVDTVVQWLSVGLGGLIGWLIGSRKDMPIIGAGAGALLGPIGWLLIGLSRAAYSCPWCGGDTPRDATVCRHCARDIDEFYAPEEDGG